MGQAVGYARAQWTALTRYADNGALAIDNNVAERAPRKVESHLRAGDNWTFCWSCRCRRRAGAAILSHSGRGHVAARTRNMQSVCLSASRDFFRRIPAHNPDRSLHRAQRSCQPCRASPCSITPMPCHVSSHAVERPQAGRLRGRRHVESEEPERDVQQPPSTRDLRMHQASASQSQGAGRVFGVMTSGMCQA